LKDGDHGNAQFLWDRYLQRLVRIASRKLGSAPRRVADEEDVVLSAFRVLLSGARLGAFSRLNDRDDLWQVLVVLVERKARDQRRRERALKRGAARVRGESVFQSPAGSISTAGGLGQIADREPTPAFAALFRDEIKKRLSGLEDPDLRQIVVGKLEGLTNRQIASVLKLSLRAVERKLRLIRRRWGEERAL